MCGVRGVVRTVLVVVALCVARSVVVGEQFHQRRDRQDQDRYQPPPQDKNVVKNNKDAAILLSKYGYLRCHIQRVVGVADIPGGGHQASAGLRPSEGNMGAGDLLLSEEGSSRICNDYEVRQAIRTYQKTYNLAPTGMLDQETKQLMSALRCGNADTKDTHMSSSSPSSSSSSQSSSSSSLRSSSSDPVGANSGVGEAQSLWKRDINQAGADDSPSPLLTALRGAAGLADMPSKQSRRVRHLNRHRAKLTHKRALAALLRRWTQKEHSRTKRATHETASGNQEQAKKLTDLEVAEHRPVLPSDDDTGMMFNKKVIRWRLLATGYSTRMLVEDLRATLQVAFRMWSEVIPVNFVEDSDSHINAVDIEVAFGKGWHQDCSRHFDGKGGEIAHSQFGGVMHFDDEEEFRHYRAGSLKGINLLRVAVHEIGHVLGLGHNPRSQSIMYAIYHGKEPLGEFELNREDRQTVQRIYGVCKGSFSTVFDWVRERPDGKLVYNTYFFRGDHYWMYENHVKRTRYGDPLHIAREWKRVPNNVDGYLDMWLINDTHRMHENFFFKGKYSYRYNNENDTVHDGWPHLIQEDFPTKPGQSEGIPNNLDSVFFDWRNRLVYFFKDDTVYVYNPYSTQEARGCCERIRPINEEFPSAPDSKVPLEGRLDAVYYSYADGMQYFIKGEKLWRNRVFDRQSLAGVNSVEYMGKWYDYWLDICDVETH
ncbi:hypothetical protein ACOMHN_023438 [Nucella lapillus]